MPGSYGIAPIFLIRMAGVPFDAVTQLATPETFRAARELEVRRTEFDAARAVAERFFESGERLLSEEAFRALRSAVKQRRAPKSVEGAQPQFFTAYAEAAQTVAAAERELTSVLEHELSDARARLLGAARRHLPGQLVFNTGGVSDLFELLLRADATSVPPQRNTRVRERERHLLLYLQRVAGKNDSFSEFGPTSWGRSEAAVERGISFAPAAGISARETFMERWTAHAVAAVMNHDPAVANEAAPRPSPRGRLVDHTFMFADTGESQSLDAAERDTFLRCDGRTPAHALGEAAALASLINKGVVRCDVEVPAMEPHAFDVLYEDVRNWRESGTRSEWLPILQPLAQLPKRLAATTDIATRRAILDEGRGRLQALGIERAAGERHLYKALNPVGEECFRESAFRMDPALLDQVAVDAAPWMDLWRDCYAFIASRVAETLRRVLRDMPGSNGAVPLPAFLRACEAARLPLTGPGLVAPAHIAFQEVKAAFRKMIEPFAGEAEHELTAEECQFVRRNFEFPAFDEYTYPSADLQIAADSMAAVGRGDYQWILAELHPPAALLHHGAYWSCPDHSALRGAFAAGTRGKPNFHFGFFAADFTAHTTVRIFDALPHQSYFVAPQRGNPSWKTVAPAEVEVFVDESTGDVGARRIGSGEYLGSFARAWLIPLGFHPFYFGRAPHMPRLRCGKVIVQRRSWTVTVDELEAGDFTGISRHLVVALERLRARKEWPRYIYVRPTEQALRRSGVEGRDKDTKPILIDLESYLFLELFHHWLVKAGELEVTEMLPAPDQLCWQEEDGRRTFEMRTLVVPR